MWVMAPALEIVPTNQATWEDLQAVFGTSGDPARCWCQRYKMAPGESWASVGAEELAFRLRQQTDCGHPESDTTTGLVAYLGGEPVGWCASMYVEALTTAYADTGRIVAWCDRNATRMAVYDEVVTAAGGRPPARYAPDDFNRLLEE